MKTSFLRSARLRPRFCVVLNYVVGSSVYLDPTSFGRGGRGVLCVKDSGLILKKGCSVLENALQASIDL